MADNKKYYYMRLKDSFFDDDAIKILESMQDGYIYSNILLKLYLKSLKNCGKLMFNDRIPYTPKILATITGHQVGTVEKALETFQQLGLVEILENGAMYMNDIQSLIGKSSTEADRKRDYDRLISEERRKVGEISEKSTPEIEIEKEIEKEIDIELKIDKEKEEVANDNPSPSPKKKKDPKHKYGEFDNVLLTDKERDKLLDDLGNETYSKCIKKLDEYIETSGRKYKNHNLVIRGWVIKAIREEEQKDKPKINNPYVQGIDWESV